MFSAEQFNKAIGTRDELIARLTRERDAMRVALQQIVDMGEEDDISPSTLASAAYDALEQKPAE